MARSARPGVWEKPNSPLALHEAEYRRLAPDARIPSWPGQPGIAPGDPQRGRRYDCSPSDRALIDDLLAGAAGGGFVAGRSTTCPHSLWLLSSANSLSRRQAMPPPPSNDALGCRQRNSRRFIDESSPRSADWQPLLTARLPPPTTPDWVRGSLTVDVPSGLLPSYAPTPPPAISPIPAARCPGLFQAGIRTGGELVAALVGDRQLPSPSLPLRPPPRLPRGAFPSSRGVRRHPTSARPPPRT